MSLAAASEARKARLLALRNKRAGGDIEDSQYVSHIFTGTYADDSRNQEEMPKELS